MFNLLAIFSNKRKDKRYSSKNFDIKFSNDINNFDFVYHDKEKVREYYFIIKGFHYLVHVSMFHNSKVHTQQTEHDKIKDRCFSIAETYGIHHDFYRHHIIMSPLKISKHNIGFYKIKMNGLISHYYILLDGLKIPIDRYKDEYDNDMRKKMRNYLENYHQITVPFEDVFIREDLNINTDFLKNSHNININETSTRK